MSGKKRHSEEEHSITEGELNLVPYLDIMVNLIMFMLLTFQVLAELRIINFNPPASTQGTGSNDPTAEKKLLLTVVVTSAGHSIITDASGAGTESVPRKGADYDYGELTKRIERLKKDLGDQLEENIVIVAEPAIEYEYIVHTLDSLRATPDGKELFPMVTLGMAVGTQ